MLKTMAEKSAKLLCRNLYLEVHPFRETVCILTVRRWLKNGVHFIGSASDGGVGLFQQHSILTVLIDRTIAA